MAPFFALGLGEFGIRLVLTMTSLLSVYLVYRVGARVMNPWVGMIGAALFSCHYLNLFYTERIMCEIPYVTLALLALVFFPIGSQDSHLGFWSDLFHVSHAAVSRFHDSCESFDICADDGKDPSSSES